MPCCGLCSGNCRCRNAGCSAPGKVKSKRIKLSAVQQEVIDKMKATGSLLYRWPGGFWTTKDRLPRVFLGPNPPSWYVTIGTVRALERKGLLCRTYVYEQEWEDIRQLKEGTETHVQDESN